MVIGALGTVTKGLILELEDLEIKTRVETILTTALLRKAKIARSVQETWGIFCPSNFSEKTSAYANGKNFEECNNNSLSKYISYIH